MGYCGAACFFDFLEKSKKQAAPQMFGVVLHDFQWKALPHKCLGRTYTIFNGKRCRTNVWGRITRFSMESAAEAAL
jgi:hypothetical protein